MKIDFEGCSSFTDCKEYSSYAAQADKACEVLLSGTGAGNGFTGWLTLPQDTREDILSGCEEICREWSRKGVDLVTVLGIGGSYLGAKCAIEALSHSFIGRQDAPKVVFAGNNLSEDYMAELLDLAAKSNVACVVISKSGTTTETAVAFRIIKKFIEDRYGAAEAAGRIVAVTDAARGALKTLSTTKGYRTFVIPDNVGGRFSVLTPVGLLPVALAGFDIRKLIEGAREASVELRSDGADNPAKRYAAMRNYLYAAKGRRIEVLVNYNPKLRYFGEWWKQLFGESEGKGGKGIFPASADFTTDLHSLGQMFQDGERILFETVLNVENPSRSVRIEKEEEDLDQLNYLAGKSIDFCNKMAMEGTTLAHIEGGVPQIRISFDRIDEWNLGYLFYFFEFACGISAYMLGVNPFDQPGVEAYKKKMFKLLEKPGC